MDRPGNNKESKVYHVNCLKKWNALSCLIDAYLGIMSMPDEKEYKPSDPFPWDDSGIVYDSEISYSLHRNGNQTELQSLSM